jgi:hypothetical protein
LRTSQSIPVPSDYHRNHAVALALSPSALSGRASRALVGSITGPAARADALSRIVTHQDT